MRIDVFCRVVDNYGDAGVAWRLARQLVREHGCDVTLRIDAPEVLARLEPDLDPARGATCAQGVRVRRYDDLAPDDLPDVVVEAFGAGLPDDYLGAMARQARPPAWVNLEYLSAEPWIETAHGLPSPQPRLPLTRYFFFPGFTPRTGGLLREHGLFPRRDAARRVPRERRLADAVARPVAQAGGLGDLAISLFCYANPVLPALLDAWAEGDERITCLVPHGVAAASFDAWLGGAVPQDGKAVVRGALTVVGIPFTRQDDYDRLLWTCDVNFVRGEDSLVRAQWAATPFAWHVYPQADDAHRVKLEAFLARYLADAEPAVDAAVRDFALAWNAADGAAAAAAWGPFRAAAPAIARHGARWADALATMPDLATALLDFCRERL